MNKIIKKNLNTILLFVGILVLGFLLRSAVFLHGDFLYLVDQSRDLLLAKSIVVNHKLTLIGGRTGFGGLFHGALWIYFIVPFFIFAKGNPFLTLIPLFEIVNLGVIVAGFMVGWKLYGKWIGILLAYFLSISQVLINETAFTSNAQVLPIVLVFYLYCVFRFLRKDDKYFAFALFFAGLSFQFESAFAILLIPLTLVSLLIRRKIPSIKIIGLGIVSFTAAISTFLLFDLRHQFLMTNSVIKLFTDSKKPLPGYEQYANLGFRVHDRVVNFINSLFSPLYSNEKILMGILVLIIAAALLFILRKILSDKKITDFHREYIFILLSPVVIFGTYIIYPFPLWPHYLLPVSIFFVLLLIFSVKILWQSPLWKLICVAFVFFSCIQPFNYIFKTYLNRNYEPILSGSYRAQLAVAKWVIGDSRNKSAGYFVYTPGTLTYSMDYLLWWEGKNEGVSLTNAKASSTYLVLYPGPSRDANAQVFWKKNVLHTEAKVKVYKNFPGDVTVEKLDLSKDSQAADPNYFQNLIFR